MTLNPDKCDSAVRKEFDIGKLNRTLFHYRFYERVARTAACNSRRGIVSYFRGIKQDLAATKFTSYVPCFVF